MEPALITNPRHLDTLRELMQLEQVFQHPVLGTARKGFEKMMDDDFWETGASGRRYSREYVLDVLEKRVADRNREEWQTKDFHCLEIARDNYLLTYTIIEKERVTRRASIWRRADAGWKIVYHQGTIVEGG